LGIELTALPPDQAGVLVRDVFPGSPAQLAGLQNGDIILQLDGSPVGRPQQVIAEVLEHRAGERLGLVVMRQGDQRLLNVLLGRRPDTEDLLRQRYLGAAAPDLSSGQVAQGTAQPSLHGLRGRVVVLEFWASWCLPCRALMPTLNGWHDRFAAQGVTVIGVTADSVVEAASHATTLGMRYNILADPDALITRSYRALALPTLFVIDKRGNVRDVMVGFRPDRMAEIGQLLERLIKES
jgi:peroxiredoxin